MDRRTFVRSVAVSAGVLAAGGPWKPLEAAAQKPQKFLVGFAPATDGTLESYWKNCAACAKAGFRNVETNNTRLKLAQTYVERMSEFREKMDALNLRLVGMNQNHPFLDPSKAQEIRETNIVFGKFLRGAGAIYAGWEGPLVPTRPDGQFEQEQEGEMRRMARLANEEGKRLWEEYGLKFTFHPQSTAGLGRLMDLTNPAYFHLNPDLGWLAARGGADAVEICRAYLSRIMAIHFKDFDPTLESEWQGRRWKGSTVLWGKGTINFPALVDFLREAEFGGCVMGEHIGLGTFDFARSPEAPTVFPVFKEYVTNKLGLQL